MSMGRKILFISSFIIIDFLLLFGILFVRDITFENLLRKELKYLSDVDNITSNFSLNVQSSGKYAVLEAAVKKYLVDYSDNFNLIFNGYDREKINSFLDIGNYTDNIEKFNDNLEYLELIRRSFNNNVETFSNQLSTTDLSGYVKGYISDDDYIELCDVMLEDGYLLDNLADNHLVIENKRIEFNSYLDSIYNVVIFLRDNYDNYTIINDEIIFSDSAIEDEYYTFVRKAKHFEK